MTDLEASLARMEKRLQRMAEAINAILHQQRLLEQSVTIRLGAIEEYVAAIVDGDGAAPLADPDEPAVEMAECNGRHVLAPPLTLADRVSTRIARGIERNGAPPPQDHRKGTT